MFNIFKSPLPAHLLPIRSGETTLAEHQGRVAEINRLIGVQSHIFDKFYKSALLSLAELVQELPASEYHHHSNRGGLLLHVLTTIIYALRERKKYQLPLNQPPETTSKMADTYTYAVFVGALMHDLGKVAADIDVRMYSKSGDDLGLWNPLSGPLTAFATTKHYDCKYRAERVYTNHESASLLMSSVVPPDGWNWIRLHADVFKQFLAVFDGTKSEVQMIVKAGDQVSTARAMGAKNKPDFVSSRPLHTLFLPTLRSMIDAGSITLNRKGAQGWVSGNSVWLMSKIVVDELRKKLHSEGHASIPTDNTRIFDIMAEQGLIEQNNDKAIWRAKVSSQDWKPGTFTLIKIALEDLFSGADDAPKQWDGLVVAEHATKDEASDESRKSEVVPLINKPDTPKPDKTRDVRSLFLNTASKPAPEVAASGKKEAEPTVKQETQVEEKPPLRKSFLTTVNATAQSLEPEDQSNQNAVPVDSKINKAELGTTVLNWLKSGLMNKTISMNTSKSFVHIVPEGLGIVSPAIFKEFSKTYQQWTWGKAQTSFQSLRLNLKHPKTDENVLKYRVEGGRTLSIISLWVLPLDVVDEEVTLPRPNEHLKLVE